VSNYNVKEMARNGQKNILQRWSFDAVTIEQNSNSVIFRLFVFINIRRNSEIIVVNIRQ
jgi:hypothetical protein